MKISEFLNITYSQDIEKLILSDEEERVEEETEVFKLFNSVRVISYFEGRNHHSLFKSHGDPRYLRVQRIRISKSGDNYKVWLLRGRVHTKSEEFVSPLPNVTIKHRKEHYGEYKSGWIYQFFLCETLREGEFECILKWING